MRVAHVSLHYLFSLFYPTTKNPGLSLGTQKLVSALSQGRFATVIVYHDS